MKKAIALILLAVWPQSVGIYDNGGKAVVTTLATSAIAIHDNDGKAVVTITSDGEVKYGENVNVSDASKAFWKAVADKAPCKKP